jgi:FkbM family methyltransferase
MQYGQGDAFRQASWIERAAAACRGPLASSSLRGPLKRTYEAILDRLPGDRLVCRFPGGESVRLSARFRQVTWNAEEYSAFRQDVKDRDLVLDVGANLGAYTLLFAQWAGSAGHVYAFEPAPEARQGLERHISLNGLDERTTVVASAMSDRDGLARFSAAGPRGDNRLTGDDGKPSIEVPTTSIDAFRERLPRSPGLIKIDVEGAELHVLRGARTTIAEAGPNLKLYIEMHPRLWASYGASREAIEAELEHQGLALERLDGGSDVWEIEGVCLRVKRCGS